MDSITSKKNSKRKISDNAKDDLRKKIRLHSQNTIVKQVRIVSEIDLFKDASSSVTNAYNKSLHNGLKKFSVHNKIQCHLQKTSNKESFDDCNSVNDHQRIPISPKPPYRCNSSADISGNNGKKFSANNRLQNLRREIANKPATKEWFTSDVNLPSPTRSVSNISLEKSQSCDEESLTKMPCRGKISENRKFNNLPKFKRTFFHKSVTQPLHISSSVYGEAQTDYDDSESAIEFGSNTLNLKHNKRLQLSCVREQKNLPNDSTTPECKLNERLTNHQRVSNVTVFNKDLPHATTVHFNNRINNSQKSFAIRSPKIVQQGIEPKSIRKVENTIFVPPKPYSVKDRLKNIHKGACIPKNNALQCIRKEVKERPNVAQSCVNISSCISIKNNGLSINNNKYVPSNHLESYENITHNSPCNNTAMFRSPSFLDKCLTDINSSDLSSIGAKANLLAANHKPNVNESQSEKIASVGNELFDRLLSTDYAVPVMQVNNLKPTLLSTTRRENVVEPMDWNDIDENTALSHLQNLRETVMNTEDMTYTPQTTFQEIVAKASPEMPQNITILKDIYVVVDTNIFISHLEMVKQILTVKINGVETPIILIPWMVIQELDYIKDGRSGDRLKGKAQNAIHYINRKLTQKDSFVKGQSVMDAAQQEFSSKNPDDGILNCCLQIIKKGHKATLLSNDVNLRNKALLHDVPAYGNAKIISALDPYHCKEHENTDWNVASIEDDKIKELRTYLSHTCSFIIFKVLEQDYGPIWEQIKTTNPPWSLQQCIELFQKYWIPVFSMHFNKHFAKLLDDFGNYLKTKPYGVIPIEDGEKLLEFSLASCVFLKNGLPNFKATVDLCINNIQNVAL